MSPLARAVGGARFTFVVGKGGVGKSTTAAALALELADAGSAVHLVSTDPAHSVGDVFGEPPPRRPTPSACSPLLVLEEFDAAAYGAAWLARATGPVTELVERGTYLDAEDVAGFTRLALPGVDELMAVLRLTELDGGGARVVVDTAPTGHTLRMLDAAATHEGIARALQAMADKAAAVISGFAGRAVRLRGEDVIAELDGCVAGFRRILRDAAFVIVARDDDVVMTASRRLAGALGQRGLPVAATVFTGPPKAGWGACVAVPLIGGPGGCDGLRRWRESLEACSAAAAPAGAVERTAWREGPAGAPRGGATAPSGAGSAESAGERAPGLPAGEPAPAVPWLERRGLRLIVFAGKGGTGKTTCAAAAALALAGTRRVLLCSADPAGALEDVLVPSAGALPPALRLVQVDAAAALARVRDGWREEVTGALERIGLSAAATLDRRVVEALWELAPPGIDEFAALAALLDAADADETIVLDPAPTGHFLRLLTLPGTALDWTRQLMRVILKYGATGAAGGAAQALLTAARQLRHLQELIADPARTGVLVVTLAEPVVQAETARLLDALRDGGVSVAGVIVNRRTAAAVAAGGAEPWVGLAGPGVPVISAPELQRREGVPALRRFIDTWTVSA